jgi:Domain of unknown function (DUF2431)/Zinc finger, C2H2 type
MSEKINSNVDNSIDDDDEVIFITLGDGDFTWSLDFGRYIFATTATTTTLNCRLIATGIDSEEEVAYKYRHYSTLVEREWQRLQHQAATTNSAATVKFTVEKRHGINALDNCSLHSNPVPPGHFVFFHHPHLGTENAALHAQFLSHLLHSVAQYWLRRRRCPDRPLVPSQSACTPICAVFYLTLVEGQWERWNGPQAARRHGMILTERLTFVPTPVLAVAPSDDDIHQQNTGNKTTTSTTTTLYYEHRRHQTGKSFAARAKGGSETLVFVRQQDADFVNSNRPRIASVGNLIDLPWFVPKSNGAVTAVDHPDGRLPGVVNESSKPSSQCPIPFPCRYCPKSFREARSLTNHVQSKHSSAKAADTTSSMTSLDDDNNDRKRKHKESDSDETVTHLVCPYCEATPNISNSSTRRTFDSPSALQAHITAKHTALHATIPPDDSSSSPAHHGYGPSADLDFGICDICGHVFVSALDQTNHETAFVPVPSSSRSEAASTHHCRFCDKSFRQTRAVLQHENFCAHRHRTDQSLSSTASLDPMAC